MTDSPRAQVEPPAPSTAPARLRWTPASLISVHVIGPLALAVIPFCTRFASGEALWGLEFALAATLLTAGVWSAIRRQNVEGELARLIALLPEVRNGHEPIDALSNFDGPVSPAAALCQELLRDLRQERSRTGRLEEEIRQRIAGRTEALERQIGALRQQAARDALTGLFNRRMLDAYLPEALERCKASATHLSLLMIDVDHFKQLNDTLGHATGDQMLRSIAQIIRSAIRDTDLAFRCGGDEFVIVLEDSEPVACQALVQRLASLGDALGRTYRLIPSPRLSIGTSTDASLREPTPQELLRLADESLYQVKAAHHAAAESARPRRSA